MLSTTIQHEKLYLVVMGIIHGFTNLGGSLLTAIVHQKSYDKHNKRATIAICYASFALFQLATLALIGSEFELNFSEHSHFLQIGILVFLLTEETVYNALDNQKYHRIFALFLFLSGLLLILK